jgi:hypothetical protein
MNHTNTVMLAIFVALGVMLVAGLMAIPTIIQAQARLAPPPASLQSQIEQRILSALRDFGISFSEKSTST